METKDIVVNAFNQELIPYHNPDWPHSLLYTELLKTTLNYIPVHWHPDVQFLVATCGIVHVHIAGDSQTLNEGEGLFINSGVIHEIHPGTEDAAFICWNIGTEVLDSHLKHTFVMPVIKNKSLPFLFLSPENTADQKIISSIYQVYQSFKTCAFGFELTVTSLYLMCLKHVVERMKSTHGQSDHLVYDPRIKTMLEYIHSNYTSEITLKDLSETAFLSRSETIRLFKKHIGKTPFQYLLIYRLEHSVQFLMTTESSISEIAFECGFSSTSYYISKFKTHYQRTPYQYRKINGGDDSKQ